MTGTHGGRRAGAGAPRGKSQLKTKATPKQKRILTDMAREYTEEALRTLVELMRDQEVPAGTRFSAANALLDRGYGKPAQAIQHQTEDGAPLFTFLRQIELEVLEENEEQLQITDAEFKELPFQNGQS